EDRFQEFLGATVVEIVVLPRGDRRFEHGVDAVLLARPLAPAILRRRSHADAVDPASDGRPAVEIAETAMDDDENLLTHVGHVSTQDAELRQDAPDELAASLEDFVEIGRRRDRRIVARVESFHRTDLHASHWRRLAEFLDQNKCPTPKYPPPP